ncbi:MAG: hypothetical protein A4E53_03462 [Pelotomaculum sp. PtaB.Bin104]|nr:MAG: hypothetical protein A4E53_03462 [Pelotomaculum sp. PtaB.Bin104]
MIKMLALLVIVGGLLLGMLFVVGLLLSSLKMRKWAKPVGLLLFNLLKSRRRW